MPLGSHVRQTTLELLLEVTVGAVKRSTRYPSFLGQGLDVAASAGRDLATQQPVDCRADAVLVLPPPCGADRHRPSLSAGAGASSLASTTRCARSCSVVRRVFSPTGIRGLPRKVSVVFAQPAQTFRCSAWKVAWGQRAASPRPANGLVAVGVPASFRQSALPGSVNQQKFAGWTCNVADRFFRSSSTCRSEAMTVGCV